MRDDEKAAVESRIDALFPSRRWVPMSKAIWPTVEIRMSELEAVVLENVRLCALVEAAYREGMRTFLDAERTSANDEEREWLKSDARKAREG